MDSQTLHMWLDGYREAWEQQDPEQAAELFSEDAVYYETPFAEPFSGREAIRRYWLLGAASAQQDITFGFEVVGISGSVGVARWTASFTRVPSGARVELDGVLVATFGDRGRCTVFREWWHRRETLRCRTRPAAPTRRASRQKRPACPS
jgi:ketosteroid isomerase-like protein